MAAHRYWRWLFSSSASGNYALIGEAEMMTAVGGPDVTGTGTASADSVYSGSTSAANAFANNGISYASNQCWESANTAYPHWLQYDFGAGNPQDIVQYTITSSDNYANEAPKSWEFQYSDDGSSWTTVDTRAYHSWAVSLFRYFIVGVSNEVELLNEVYSVDVEDGGVYQIAGKITEFLVPGSYRVRLYDQKTGRDIRETWSDSSGNYTFDNIDAKPKFVIAFDHSVPVQNAVIQDNVVPS